MNTKRYKLLHYTLIILLMFAPLRSVFAAQFMTCDMSVSMDAMALTDTASASKSANAHHQHMMNSTQNAVQVKISQVDMAHIKNCCGDKAGCMSDCHLVISVSLFMQNVDYTPLLINTDTINNISSALLARELSPPSRPPLALL